MVHVKTLLFVVGICMIKHANAQTTPSPTPAPTPAPTPTPTPAPLLGPPTQQKPANNSAGLSTGPILFNWTAVTGANGYRLQIDDDSAFAMPIVDDATIDSPDVPHTLPAGTLTASSIDPAVALTRYYWRVATLQAGNLTGTWSPTWSFTVRRAYPHFNATLTDGFGNVVYGCDDGLVEHTGVATLFDSQTLTYIHGHYDKRGTDWFLVYDRETEHMGEGDFTDFATVVTSKFCEWTGTSDIAIEWTCYECPSSFVASFTDPVGNCGASTNNFTATNVGFTSYENTLAQGLCQMPKPLPTFFDVMRFRRNGIAVSSTPAQLVVNGPIYATNQGSLELDLVVDIFQFGIDQSTLMLMDEIDIETDPQNYGSGDEYVATDSLATAYGSHKCDYVCCEGKHVPITIFDDTACALRAVPCGWCRLTCEAADCYVNARIYYLEHDTDVVWQEQASPEIEPVFRESGWGELFANDTVDTANLGLHSFGSFIYHGDNATACFNLDQSATADQWSGCYTLELETLVTTAPTLAPTGEGDAVCNFNGVGTAGNCVCNVHPTQFFSTETDCLLCETGYGPLTTDTSATFVPKCSWFCDPKGSILGDFSTAAAEQKFCRAEGSALGTTPCNVNFSKAASAHCDVCDTGKWGPYCNETKLACARDSQHNVGAGRVQSCICGDLDFALPPLCKTCDANHFTKSADVVLCQNEFVDCINGVASFNTATDKQVCTCDAGFGLDANGLCSVPAASTECNFHGVLADDDTTCDCYVGWAGAKCAGPFTSAHGRFDETLGYVVCDKGWSNATSSGCTVTVAGYLIIPNDLDQGESAVCGFQFVGDDCEIECTPTTYLDIPDCLRELGGTDDREQRRGVSPNAVLTLLIGTLYLGMGFALTMSPGFITKKSV